MLSIPDSLGQCADELMRLKAEKSILAAQVKQIETRVRVIKDHIINTLSKNDLVGASGAVGAVRVVSKDIATAKDWGLIYDHIHSERAFDLLARKLSTAAVALRWEQGIEVPGVDHFNQISVSLTKAKV